MSQPTGNDHLRQQVERARATLGEALGHTQEIRWPGLDENSVSASLKGGVKALFAAESSGMIDELHVGQAMECLQRTLTLMQEVPDQDQKLEIATAAVARTMAILFPLFKALEGQKFRESQPIPLTGAISAQREAAPLPLSSLRRPDSAASDRERRGTNRKSVEVDIGMQSETNFFTGFSLDISSGGLFVSTYDILPLDSEVNVNFSLPGGPMMSLNGLVRWIRDYNEAASDTAPGMGIMFEGLSVEEENDINAYLARSNPIFHEM
jgi:uncharacterized protein (TIGR02266 family)